MDEKDKLERLFKILEANDEKLECVKSEQEYELLLNKHFEIVKEIKESGGDLIDDIILKKRIF